VAIVSSSMAQRYWTGRDPIGQHFQINVPGPEYTIVGVVGDVRSASLEIAPEPTVYVPYRQDAFPSMVIVLKTPAAASSLTSAIRAGIWQVDKDQPIGAVLTMDDQLSHSLQRRRFSVTLLSIFGVVAALLAAVGLYGVLAFIVAQRRREIGVRIALGATGRDVIGEVLGQGLRLAGLGVSIGLALAVAITRLMSALLFGTSPTDVITFVGAAAFLTLVAPIIFGLTLEAFRRRNRTSTRVRASATQAGWAAALMHQLQRRHRQRRHHHHRHSRSFQTQRLR